MRDFLFKIDKMWPSRFPMNVSVYRLEGNFLLRARAILLLGVLNLARSRKVLTRQRSNLKK